MAQKGVFAMHWSFAIASKDRLKMARTITKEQLARTLAKGEEALNLIGYIPMISILSAALRTFGGKLQALIGLCFAIFSLIMGLKSSKGKICHFLNFRMGLEHFLHGLFNMLRALFEAVPFLSLVTCLPYDRVLKKRFKYTYEDSNVIEVEAEEIDSSG
jgi:hypothetical protein